MDEKQSMNLRAGMARLVAVMNQSGEWAAVPRPVQKAQWSDADGKLTEGTPTGGPSLAGFRGVALLRGSETGKSWRRGIA